jgi:hypothetical protein
VPIYFGSVTEVILNIKKKRYVHESEPTVVHPHIPMNVQGW